MTTTPELIRLLVFRLLVLAMAMGAVFLLLTSADAEAPPPPTVEHVVRPGDTLWALAAGVAGSGADLRPVVDEIEELNSLDGATIHPGQVLVLPAG